ncbi:MAG: RagB/SusD family nutrient uptake outer membrane protein [Flavobacteriia bacterium]|nr:MAG: RagB/SusD family nutrient uptake outer membrane protein [Flavobacteriia bacterium]
MKNILNKLLVVLVIALVFSACHKDLDQSPLSPNSFTEENVFSSDVEAKGALAKLYASMALTGQQGPAGQADIADIDEGFSQFSRMLFNLNELTTDHSVVGWGDPGLQDLHGLYWAAGNDFSDAMYYRLAQEVSFCNSFISNAAALDTETAKVFIAEARFLRAFAYYNLIDLYANVPLVTEISTELPQQSNRTDMFNFVESELLAIQDILVSSGANEYGRVDQVAAWALLSRLYLNAQVWIGTDRYADCVTYSEKVINSTYSINTNDINGNGTAYDELFLADNNTNGAQNEFIYVLNFDGIHSQTYGGTTFLVHASIGGSMNPAEFGVNGGWAGLRATSNLVEKFAIDLDALNAGLGTSTSDWGIVGSATPNGWNGPDMELYETGTNVYALYAELTEGEIKFRLNEDWGNNYGDDGADGTLEAGGSNIAVPAAGTYLVNLNLNDLTYSITPAAGDLRGMFHTDGQSLEIEDLAQFNQGYAVTKFKNIDSNGQPGNDATGNFVDTDLPVIRLAEIYLNYAEAVLRGGGGSESIALALVNELRTRAYGNEGGNIGSAQLSLDFILDERSRELYWEGQRRTDLVRYGYFTSSEYVWPWKGNIQEGIGVPDFRNIFPIPSNAISVNSNLNQNEGY